MREDYSESGDAWDYFTHDQARSRAYRWGEDGLVVALPYLPLTLTMIPFEELLSQIIGKALGW